MKCFPVIDEWEGEVCFAVIDEDRHERCARRVPGRGWSFIGVGSFRPKIAASGALQSCFFGRIKGQTPKGVKRHTRVRNHALRDLILTGYAIARQGVT